MKNPLKPLTEKIKKTVVLKAVKHATERYKNFKNERNKFLTKVGISGTVLLIVGTLLNYAVQSTMIFNYIIYAIGIFGTLISAACYYDRYSNAKKAWKQFESIDFNNDKVILENFDIVHCIISWSNIYAFFKWEEFDTSLSNEDIKNILNKKLTEEQRNYLKKIIYNQEKITYEHLLHLENLFNKSKEVIEFNHNTTFANFLKENKLTDINTESFFNSEKVELKEIELEAEYRRIL